MNLRNRVQLVGRVESDPIIKTFSNNKLARLSVSTTDVFSRNNKTYKDTQWHIVVAWGKYAEIAEKNLRVGSDVVIDGRLKTRSYNDSSGNKQYITEVVAETILCNNKNTYKEEVIKKTA